MWNNITHKNKSLNLQTLDDEEDDIFAIKPTDMSFQEVVENKGFDIKEYEVRTEDGYLLKVFRIRDKTIIGKDAKAIFM